MHMKSTLSVLAFLLAGSLTTAQAGTQKAQEPHGEVKDATAKKLEPGAQLQFSVTGLTQANSEKVQQSLTALRTQVYVCSGCKHEQAMAGTCTACKLEFTPKAEPALIEAVPSVDTASIRVVPVGSRTLRFSDLESTLTKNSVKIDVAKFPLAGKSRLVLRGGTLENAETIEKALVDSKLFASVEASFDVPSGEIRLAVEASAKPPMHDKVTAAIDALGTKAKLTDVIWGPPAPPTKA